MKRNEKLRRKIKSSRGETLTETLVSLLIISAAMVMLAGSIVSASKVNKTVEDADTLFHTTTTVSGAADSNLESKSGTVTITYGSSTESIAVTEYTTKDKNSYVYYEK